MTPPALAATTSEITTVGGADSIGMTQQYGIFKGYISKIESLIANQVGVVDFGWAVGGFERRSAQIENFDWREREREREFVSLRSPPIAVTPTSGSISKGENVAGTTDFLHFNLLWVSQFSQTARPGCSVFTSALQFSCCRNWPWTTWHSFW